MQGKLKIENSATILIIFKQKVIISNFFELTNT